MPALLCLAEQAAKEAHELAAVAAKHEASVASAAQAQALQADVQDCGSCVNCLDKPRFGGPGKRKKSCVLKIGIATRRARGGAGVDVAAEGWPWTPMMTPAEAAAAEGHDDTLVGKHPNLDPDDGSRGWWSIATLGS